MWTVDMPPGTQFLSMNHGKGHWVVRDAHDVYQGVARRLIRARRIPQLRRAHIELAYTNPPQRRKNRHPMAGPRIEDDDNLGLVLKWSIDAVVQEKVLANDSRKYATSHCGLVADTTHPQGLLRLMITEVTDG
jgi:hypothetical protein